MLNRPPAIRGRLIPVIAATLTVLLVIIFIIAVVRNKAVVTGMVFADKNGNGQRDSGEEGLGDISISDGVTVARTDPDGRYRLSVNVRTHLTDIAFVTVPSEYRPPTNKDQTPQFYRLLGDLKAGEERREDFGLIPIPDRVVPNFNFVVLADVHVEAGSDTNDRARFSGQVAQINQLTGSPSFIMIAGDLTNRATDREFQDYTAATGLSKFPVYSAAGNHEFSPGKNYRTRIERYRRYLGPQWYSFEVGGRHFVVLENHLGIDQSEQFEWLQQDLEQNAKQKEVIVIVHKPFNAPVSPESDEEHKKYRRYVDLFARYHIVLVLAGHTHLNEVARDAIPGAEHVVTNSSAYTIDQTPTGFRRVYFMDGKMKFPFKMYDVERSLTIVHPESGSVISQGGEFIQVNAYNTASEVMNVEYRVDQGPWEKLSQSSAFTWATVWETGEVLLGAHRIEVRATDDSGGQWRDSSDFSIARPTSAPLARGADWPMFHGNAQHTGETKDLLAPPLKLSWSHRSPGSIVTSSPAIVDGVVYIGIRDEDGIEHSGVLAADLASGATLWQFKTDAQVHASPAVADGIVYAPTVQGTLYPKNGS